mmetsp:Transcript_22752/g.53089  ORF Transcript_22752/g.53089 Transcript_22752/m.53089 type:complete len:296 (-) Transcript_22752:109-996(-)
MWRPHHHGRRTWSLHTQLRGGLDSQTVSWPLLCFVGGCRHGCGGSSDHGVYYLQGDCEAAALSTCSYFQCRSRIATFATDQGPLFHLSTASHLLQEPITLSKMPETAAFLCFSHPCGRSRWEADGEATTLTASVDSREQITFSGRAFGNEGGPQAAPILVECNSCQLAGQIRAHADRHTTGEVIAIVCTHQRCSVRKATSKEEAATAPASVKCSARGHSHRSRPFALQHIDLKVLPRKQRRREESIHRCVARLRCRCPGNDELLCISTSSNTATAIILPGRRSRSRCSKADGPDP